MCAHVDWIYNLRQHSTSKIWAINTTSHGMLQIRLPASAQLIDMKPGTAASRRTGPGTHTASKTVLTAKEGNTCNQYAPTLAMPNWFILDQPNAKVAKKDVCYHSANLIKTTQVCSSHRNGTTNQSQRQMTELKTADPVYNLCLQSSPKHM